MSEDLSGGNSFIAEITVLGFDNPWRRKWVRAFFQDSRLRFRRSARSVQEDQTVAVWGRTSCYEAARERRPATLITLEDGFIRSVGLGADLAQPLSWVRDDMGIYYDAGSPSRLENILSRTDFSADLLTRARDLRQAILEAGITKYNLHGQSWRRPPGKHVILVPGQVETDASIRFGAMDIRSNMALLQAVRQAHPGSYIVYKPHPDVVAGLRKAGRGEQDAGRWCDEIVVHASLHQLLASVDAVHVLTSLTGFEALLRQVPVITYGQPFYAGWGLTRDLMLADTVRQRRARRLDLDSLAAGALILYPTYISRATGRYATPEQVLKELAAWRLRPEVPAWRHWVARMFGAD